MKISKILNNNAVIVRDGDREKVVVGAGVAFGKKRNDPVPADKIEKVFVMTENEQLSQLLGRIPEEHFTVSEAIISRAEKALGTKLNEHIHLVLTDHLSFAIERTKDGIHVHNKLLGEIRLLYPKEYGIGLWGIGHIRDTLGVEMPVDEAGFIALHLHTMKPHGSNLNDTIRQATIVRDMLRSIRGCLQQEIEEDDISYQRLVTHLQHSVANLGRYDAHTLDREMAELIRTRYAESYQCAKVMAAESRRLHEVEIPEPELAYIALHIERLRNPSNQGT
ncbi:PRD domain-containing protein [Bhargavaea massiliensis]|uniref:PRD domain-containing protein n=1 Tax=Bhargavaea massiliensis TaxID=2697500 RepID=UPI001BCE5848|nr:PRD domain-containing protein [Bhargavaea massiliensis]